MQSFNFFALLRPSVSTNSANDDAMLSVFFQWAYGILVAALVIVALTSCR